MATTNFIDYSTVVPAAWLNDVDRKVYEEYKTLADFGTVGDGSTDDTTAVQLGFTWLAAASYRKLFGVPGQTYKITSKLTVGGTYAQFDGQSCGFKYAFSATPADPMMAITTATWFTLGNFTQTVDVNTGKGHAISLIGNGLTPSFIRIHDIGINSVVGAGKDSGGSSMNACGLYAYGIAKLDIDNVFIQDSENGFYFDTCDKLTMTRSVADDCTNQGVYLNTCVNVDIGGGTVLNGCGTTGQGQLEFVGVKSLSFHNSRIKGGAGSQILSSGTSVSQKRVSIRDNHFEVYSNTDDAIKLRTNCVAAVIDGNDIQVVPDGGSTYTALINIVDTPGVVGYGGRIVSNNIRLGGACAVTDAIKLSSSTNATRGWVIESNTIGSTSAADVGGASTITNAINLSGTGADNKIRSNVISGASTQTITNGIVISANQTNAEVDGNRFDGTVTNQYVDSGVQTVSDQTGSFTPVVYGSSSAGVGTYSVQVGRYVRTGKLVHITINLVWSAHTGTGDLRISGLPNTLTSTTNDNPVGTCLADALTFTGQLAVYGNAGVAWVRLASVATGAALAFVQIDTAATLLITMMYEVA